MDYRESETCEFKKGLVELRQGLISIASMLNKHGYGKLYFGISNDGEIKGLQLGIDTTHKISLEIKYHIKPRITPNIEVKEIDGKSYIYIYVEGDDSPYSAYGRYYIRSDDEDLEMDQTLLQSKFQEKSLDYSKWELTPSPYGLTDVDEDRLIEFFNQANSCGRINYSYKDNEDALTKLGLYKEGKLNNAGVYLFSSIKPLKLKLAIFNTDERLSYSDIDLFEGNMFDCIEKGISYIYKSMKWQAKIVGPKRVEVPEIPTEAIREIVVNSFAHMKISPSAVNEIYLTPSKIKISNPGGIVKGIDPKEFASGKKGPFLRNPLIAMTLYKNMTIDSFATGFKRCFSLCEENGITYSYLDDELGFSFTFDRNNEESISINEMKINQKGDRRSLLLRALEKNPSLDREKLSLEIGSSPATVARDLKLLQESGQLERVGSKKKGYWRVNRN